MSTSLAVFSLVGALFATSVGHINFKLYYLRSKNIYLVVSLFFFGMAPVLSFFSLIRLSLGTVYISTAFTQVLILILSKTILKENINKDHIISMFFIVFGIIIYNF